MTFLSDFAEIVRENRPLGPLTYFGVGGPARWLVSPRSLDELVGVVQRCRQEDVPMYVLGKGANLLVSDDGVDGVVLRLDAPAFKKASWETDRAAIAAGTREADPDGTAVEVGAGMSVGGLMLESMRRGLAGLECMAGIPGSMGGMIRMNAGGRFGQISDVVCDVSVLDDAGQVRRLARDEVGFSYRHTELGESIIVGANLVLRPEDAARIRARYTQIWDYKKKSQPLAEYSAGCVFKNPPGESAGRLIDKAGLKGYSVGGAFVSEQHGNFIVAKEGARARDILALIGTILRKVAEQFGVELELEIQVWGRTSGVCSLGAGT